MSNKTIFTLESRENSYLEVTKDYLNLSNGQMYDVIQELFDNLIFQLKTKKNINYNELRNALTPNINKREIALVFDSNKIESAWYGYEIFNKVIPIFNKKTTHSILSGDIFITNNNLKNSFLKEIKTIKIIDILNLNSFYIVYINNLSNSLFDKLHNELSDYLPYIGYIDTTCQTHLKTVLSATLCKICVLNNCLVIVPGEDDNWDEDVNTQGLPFDKNNFIFKSIPDIYFDLFLSYKIEREDIKGYSLDTQISINAITPIVTDLENLIIEIEESKFNYLLTEKVGKLKKAQLENFSIEEFNNLIKNKIKDNYIYEMTELKEFNVIKFNLIIELSVLYTTDKIKCSATFHYNPKENKLKLITFF